MDLSRIFKAACIRLRVRYCINAIQRESVANVKQLSYVISYSVIYVLTQKMIIAIIKKIIDTIIHFPFRILLTTLRHPMRKMTAPADLPNRVPCLLRLRRKTCAWKLHQQLQCERTSVLPSATSGNQAHPPRWTTHGRLSAS